MDCDIDEKYNNYIKNQNVGYIYDKEGDFLTVVSNQSASTPGIRKLYKLDPKRKYKFFIEGYVDDALTEVLLWIGDINCTTLLFDDKYK